MLMPRAAHAEQNSSLCSKHRHNISSLMSHKLHTLKAYQLWISALLYISV